MKTLTAIATTLALLTSSAIAKPRAHRTAKPKSAAVEQFLADCVHERTGPTDGISFTEAEQLCKGIVKHNAKIAKLAERIHKAVEACEEEVSIACEDTTLRDHDDGTCSDDALRAKHAFDVCHPPVDGVAVAKGVK